MEDTMKKVFMLITIMLLLMATASFAAVEAYEAGSITLGNGASILPVDLSNKVMMTYVSDSTGLGYVVGTYHTSGTRTFGGSSGDAKIFWFDGTNQAIPATAPTGTAGATWPTGWLAL
jgi:hypothetical protein